MFNKTTRTRLGPMAQNIQIPAAMDLKTVLYGVIHNEIMNGYKDNDQRVFSTYIHIENSYAGCLRYSQDYDHGNVIRLKMYNSSFDSTRRWTTEVSEAKGQDTEPLFLCGVSGFRERLCDFLDVWLAQFKPSQTNKCPVDDFSSMLPGMTIDKGCSIDVQTFIEIASDANQSTLEVDTILPLLSESGDNEFTIILSPGGGGEIWKCITNPIYSQNGDMRKPGLWRLVFNWIDYPEEGFIDLMQTDNILTRVMKGSYSYSYVNEFPSPK